MNKPFDYQQEPKQNEEIDKSLEAKLNRQDTKFFDKLFDVKNKQETNDIFEELGRRWTEDGKLDISKMEFKKDYKIKGYDNLRQGTFYTNIYRLLGNKKGKISSAHAAIEVISEYCQKNNINIFGKVLTIDQLLDIKNKNQTNGIFQELGRKWTEDGKLDISDIDFNQSSKIIGLGNIIQLTFYTNIYRLLGNKKGKIESKQAAIDIMSEYCQKNGINIVGKALTIHQILNIKNKDKTNGIFEELGRKWTEDGKLDIGDIKFIHSQKIKGLSMIQSTFYTNIYRLLGNKKGKIESKQAAIDIISEYCQKNNINIMLPKETLDIDQVLDIKNKNQTKQIFVELGRKWTEDNKLDISNTKNIYAQKIAGLNDISYAAFYTNIYRLLGNKKGKIHSTQTAIGVISEYCQKNNINIIGKILTIGQFLDIKNKEQTKEIFQELGLKWINNKLDISNIKFNEKHKIKGYDNKSFLTFYTNIYRGLSDFYQKQINLPISGNIHSTKSAKETIIKYCIENNIPYIYEEFDKSQNISDINNLSEYISVAKIVGRRPLLEIIISQNKGFSGLSIEYVEKLLGKFLGDSKNYGGGGNLGLNDLSSEFLGIILQSDEIKTSIIKSIQDDFIKCIVDYNKSNNYKKINYPNIYQDRKKDFEAKTIKLKPLITGLIEQADIYRQKVLNHPQIQNLKKHLGKDSTRGFPGIEQWMNIISLEESQRLLVADDMGLGKTGSAIGSVEHLKSKNKIKNALIICPANMISTWTERLHDGDSGYFVSGKAPRILVLDDKNKLDENFEDYDYIVMSSARLNDNHVDQIIQQKYDMLIIDEAHEMKNTTSGIWSQNLIKLSDKLNGSGYVLALSGTPIPNTIRDIAVMLRLLYPHKFDDISNSNLIRNIIKGGDKLHLGINLRNHTNRKRLTDWISMPSKNEETIYIPANSYTKDISKMLVEDVDLSYTQKLILLRKLYMCPRSLNPEGQIGSKEKALADKIIECIYGQNKGKIYIILNDYIQDMIRSSELTGDEMGELVESEGYIIDYVRSRLEEYSDSGSFDIMSYHGNIENNQRKNIQNQFNNKNTDKKQILFVSGNAAKVGIDLSGADTVMVYNEPYTKADLDQQIARAYRVGLNHKIDIYIFIAENSIEEGIHNYAEQKYKIIEKLIENKDILTESEMNMILSENPDDIKYHPDADFAQYYANEKAMLYDMFAINKEIGEDKFTANMSKKNQEGKTNREKYAEIYNMLGKRNYQSNANRVNSQIISIISKKNNINKPIIVDIGSATQLLSQTSPEDIQDNIINIDTNPMYIDFARSRVVYDKDGDPYNFKEAIGSTLTGSMTNTYLQDNYVDFVNISLAYHYTSLNIKKNKIDRILALIETNRILKIGGYMIINEIYSLTFAEKENLSQALALFGFEIIEKFSGSAKSIDKNNFSSNILTVCKIGDSASLDDILSSKEKKNIIIKGLAFYENKDSINGQSQILDKFMINNNIYNINLNTSDINLKNEEEKTNIIVKGLKDIYNNMELVPENILHNNGFFSYRDKNKSGKKIRKIARKLSDGSFIFVK